MLVAEAISSTEYGVHTRNIDCRPYVPPSHPPTLLMETTVAEHTVLIIARNHPRITGGWLDKSTRIAPRARLDSLDSISPTQNLYLLWLSANQGASRSLL